MQENIKFKIDDEDMITPAERVFKAARTQIGEISKKIKELMTPPGELVGEIIENEEAGFTDIESQITWFDENLNENEMVSIDRVSGENAEEDTKIKEDEEINLSNIQYDQQCFETIQDQLTHERAENLWPNEDFGIVFGYFDEQTQKYIAKGITWFPEIQSTVGTAEVLNPQNVDAVISKTKGVQKLTQSRLEQDKKVYALAWYHSHPPDGTAPIPGLGDMQVSAVLNDMFRKQSLVPPDFNIDMVIGQKIVDDLDGLKIKHMKFAVWERHSEEIPGDESQTWYGLNDNAIKVDGLDWKAPSEEAKTVREKIDFSLDLIEE